jgi:RelA/SpoT family (p)ppGpp synthetase
MNTIPVDSGSLQNEPVLYIGAEGLEFFERTEAYLGIADYSRVREAFELARQEHGEQRRHSGELFFTHPLTVAYYLAEYRLDAAALMAALLHDVAEDAEVTIEQIREQFGAEVSRLVDSVTKLKEVSAGVSQARRLTPEEIQDASLRKMFEAMTKDVRVVVIKLFDRLHNMRTIGSLPAEKQRKKAKETLAVYAPLANRLGIWRLKTELEALSLQVLEPEPYRIIHQELLNQSLKRQSSYALIAEQTIEYLVSKGIKVANVLPSPESIYSIHRSLSASGDSYHKAANPLRMVVLLEDEPSCYLSLGYLHQLWRPVPGKFDDYIAAPRDNLYQALHTTVIYASGEQLKLRFRTPSMNAVSEMGVLARWIYQGTPLWSRGIDKHVEALFSNIDESINLAPHNVRMAVQGVVEDVFRPQIMVYTPRGDVIEMPLGATPVDFAYAIHTEVGDHCQLAHVNEEPAPLNRPLQDGDQVRITKSGWARPERTWLDEDLGYLGTSKARTHVRRWFRKLPNEVAVAQGKQLLLTEMRMLGMPGRSHQEIAAILGLQDSIELYFALGRADLLPTAVSTRILSKDWYLGEARSIGRVVRSDTGEELVITNGGGRDLHLCRACKPRSGDRIIGYLQPGGGVTVHRIGCFTVRPDPLADRTIKLGWGKDGSREVRGVTLLIDVYDRSGLLFEIAELLKHEEINITSINSSSDSDQRTSRVVLGLELFSPRQLVRILHRTHALVNVFQVSCVLDEPEVG